MKRISSFLAWSFIIIGLFLSFVVIISAYYENKIQIGTLDWDYAKKVNNIAGILAFLFTGAGTFAIFLTLIKQQEQFNQTQKQVVTQQFEATFFNMLNQLFSIKNSISGKIDDKELVGQEFLNHILNELIQKYKDHLDQNGDIGDVIRSINECETQPSSKVQMLKDDLNKIYMDIYDIYYSKVGHYFRYFYNLMKFVIVNRSNIEYNDAEKYIHLIQAQLSNDELGLIFCNSISDKALNNLDENKIFNWLEEHSFLENIDSKSLLNRSLHVLYPNTIFKFLNNSEKELKTSSKLNTI